MNKREGGDERKFQNKTFDDTIFLKHIFMCFEKSIKFAFYDKTILK